MTSISSKSSAQANGGQGASGDTALRIAHRIADEIGCKAGQVNATVQMLDEGSTVPFIARYRKEATGGLDDSQLRKLEERLIYLRELEDRRVAITRSIEEQGKLTDELTAGIRAAETKSQLEDIYLPFKKKRRTKAQIAREAGLEPLADLLLGDPARTPETEASAFLDEAKGIADTKAALDGARQILMERFAENADLVGRLRRHVEDRGVVQSKLVDGMAEKGAKFADYFDYSEKWSKIPSHRALALFRGRNEGILAVDLTVDADDVSPVLPAVRMVADTFAIADRGRPADKWLMDVARFAWKVKLALHLELDLMGVLRDKAEEEAIQVFARNLKDLLLAAPAGARSTLGLDPGIRTGVKVAVVDQTGKLVDTATIYPFQPRNDVSGSRSALLALIAKHKVGLIAIGNGTASRETDKLTGDVLTDIPAAQRPVKVIVNEAGASVYSASELAAKEMPDIDVSLRGAASIARRLQDPLAELVKIEPKSIGVGQYQHDVNQTRLARALDAVVEDAVNAVGVDLNTASSALLSRISGLSDSLAKAVVDHRDAIGRFEKRSQLKDVPRLGAKAYELCAGFLRITGGKEPLDASSVHPEAYPLAKRIVKACGRDVRQIMGDASALSALDASDFTDEKFGLPTVRDILAELEKPGRDPRPEFKTAALQDGVEEISDLKPGMKLEGTVTNVTNFGAFVDVGVHQDGLVHVSQLADRFVDDPHQVVKAGDIVRVTILDVDVPRKRISMTMKSQADYQGQRERSDRDRSGSNNRNQGNRNQGNRNPGQSGPGGRGPGDGSPRGGGGGKGGAPKSSGDGSGNNAMAAALAAAMNKKRK
nr:Tex family protein [uncultured Roseibium sp.]